MPEAPNGMTKLKSKGQKEDSDESDEDSEDEDGMKSLNWSSVL